MTLRLAYTAGRSLGLTNQHHGTDEVAERMGVTRSRIRDLLQLAARIKEQGLPPHLMAAFEEGKDGKRDKEYRVGYWRPGR